MSDSGTSPNPAPLQACVPSDLTDKSLSRWFTDEVHAHDRQLKTFLRGQFPSIHDVDDLVQESYLKIWKARAARPIHRARAFLFTVARRLALDHVRRDRISPISVVGDLESLPVSDTRPHAAELLTEQERLTFVAQAIIALPGRMQEVVILHKIDGLSQSDIARRLGISPKTVENLIGRGIGRCRDFLRHRGIERF